jgi:hypothetical protein
MVTPTLLMEDVAFGGWMHWSQALELWEVCQMIDRVLPLGTPACLVLKVDLVSDQVSPIAYS